MNLFDFFISPIAGSVIGYFTNWLAIKMLFKPHEEKRVLGIKVPFTPGLIPKEKDKIAKKIGVTVGEHLLSEDAIVKILIEERTVESIHNRISNTFSNLKEKEEGIDEMLDFLLGEDKIKSLKLIEDYLAGFILQKISSPDSLDRVAEFITGQIEKILDKNVADINVDRLIQIDFIKNDFLKQWAIDLVISSKDKLRQEDATLSKIIPPAISSGIKDMIKSQIPNYMPILLSYMDKPSIQDKVKKLLVGIIEANVGKLGLMFVDEKRVYDKLVHYLGEYIEKDENQKEIIKQIEEFINYILEKPIGYWVKRIEFISEKDKIEKIYDNIIFYVSDGENINIFKSKLRDYLSYQGDMNILDIAKRFKPSILYDIKKWIKTHHKVQKEELNQLVKNLIAKELEKILQMPISKWMEGLQPSTEETIKESILKFYKDFVINHSADITKVVNIPHIVEERIIEFETDYAEKIILSVVDKELKAITWLGAVLGFIIGFFPVIFNI
ncbi:MAG: DUF445 family protein [Epulopiscium sp.]|nr:DUF445 family protein [Candidatus Epulonipiscium sp.]